MLQLVPFDFDADGEGRADDGTDRYVERYGFGADLQNADKEVEDSTYTG